MSDHDALLAAVATAPDEDTPRLVYADYLDDHADTVPCPACGGRGHDDTPWPMSNGCDTCRGSGSVSDGRRERAELIRVQVELARGMKVGAGAAKRRMVELFEQVRGRGPHAEERAFGLPRRPEGGGWVATYSDRRADRVARIGLDVPVAIIRRGFVDEARLSLAAIVGGPGRTDYPTPNVPGLAAALGRVVGLTRVTITDPPEPIRLRFGANRGTWFVEMRAVPEPLHAHLPNNGDFSKLHRSAADVIASVNATALAFCKAAAAHQAAAALTPTVPR